MKKNLILYFIILLNFLLFADNDFFNIPTGITLTLATEQSVINNNSLSLVSNPALMSDTKKIFLFEYNKIFYFAQTNYDSIGLSFGKNNKIGIVLNKFSSGEIKIRDIDGLLTNETINYSLTSITAGVSLSFELYNKKHILNIGTAESFVFDNLIPDTSRFFTNLATTYSFYNNSFVKTLRFGFVIKGINYSQLATYHLGFLVKTGSLSLINGYENRISDNKNGKIKIALLFDFPILINNKIYFGLGYGFAQNSYSDIITSGFGISFKGIIFNYSYLIHESLGSINSVQIGSEF